MGKRSMSTRGPGKPGPLFEFMQTNATHRGQRSSATPGLSLIPRLLNAPVTER
jgi:hypothetical protein